MNFSELQSRVKALCALEGWVDVSPAPDWAGLINTALHEFSWESEYLTATATLSLLPNVGIYDLPSGDWKRVTDAVLDSVTALYLTDENILRRENPLWITTPAAGPTRFWMPGPGRIQFYPTPSAAGTVTLRGPMADGPLLAPTDTPDCPEHYHEGIALLAAWRHGKAYASGEAQGRVSAYRSEAMAIIEAMNLYLTEQEAPAFQRRVRREVAQRVPLGWQRWIP